MKFTRISLFFKSKGIKQKIKKNCAMGQSKVQSNWQTIVECFCCCTFFDFFFFIFYFYFYFDFNFFF